MLRYSRAADASTSLRPHHQRWTSEPSSSSSAVVAGVQPAKTRQGKVVAAAASQQTGASKTTSTRISGQYQKNRSSSTFDRHTTTKATAASKPSLSSTLQQIGHWARRSFRSYGGGGKGDASRRPKSLNDYVMTEASSGVVVERQPEKLPAAAVSRDQSPVTTSSGYASGGDGVYSRLHELEFEKGDGRRLVQQIQRGGSRGSRRYRRRASVHASTEGLKLPPTPAEQAARPPTATAITTDEKFRGGVRLPVYENLLSEAFGRKCKAKSDTASLKQMPCHSIDDRRIDSSLHDNRINPDIDLQMKPAAAAGILETGNRSIEEYLLPVERASFISSSDSSTLRRTGNKPSPVYVNGNLQKKSSDDTVCKGRSRSLSSTRNRTLIDDTTFNFGDVQQRLSFTPSVICQSPSPPAPDNADADWDDRLSTLSLGCRRRPPVSPDQRCTTQRPDLRPSRSRSARRRLLFGSHAVTSADRRPEAVEECIWPLFKQTEPLPTISNVLSLGPAPTRRSAGLFPGLGETAESIYETIGDDIGHSRLPVRRVPDRGAKAGGEHVYDNIDDFASAPVSIDIHQLPPPLPPPPLPARRSTAAGSHEVPPLCRSDLVELDSNHVYTIADVLDSFETLAAHLPRAKQFMYDLQEAAYRHQRDHVTGQTVADDRGRRAARDAEGRWAAAAAVIRGSSNHESSTSRLDQRRPHRQTPMYSSEEIRRIVVEDYVCSPGNHLSSERPRRAVNGTSANAAATANTSHGDGLYMSMKPGNNRSNILCCGGRGSSTLAGRPPSAHPVADATRKPKHPMNKTDKKTGLESTIVSRSITELDRCHDVADRDDLREGRRTSRLFQMPRSFVDANSPTLTNYQHRVDIAQHQKALSRSLMDGISRQPSRPTSGNVADRKQNSRKASSTLAVDVATGRSGAMPPKKLSDDFSARRPQRVPRSASEDRQTGTGNSPRMRSPVAIVGDERRPDNKSRRSRAADGTSSALSRSLMTTKTVPQRPTVGDAPSLSSTSFHEPTPHSDRRRSSILQWTTASCSGREIFC